MPLRAYFLVITPALAAFLWLASWYMQPEPPKVYTTASATTASAPAVKPAASTTGAAPAAVAATSAEAAPAAPAAPAAQEITLVPSTAVEEAKPVQQAAKPKKRKHIAR